MFNYIKGTVTDIESNYIVLETNNIGYEIYTPNPYSFEESKDYKIYLYQYIREDENTLYGFKSQEEKDLFLKLISVKGLGCKMALPMFTSGNSNGIIDAIERENIIYLKKFPKIGDKVARQIILDLKGKLTSTGEPEADNLLELKEALKSLGYKSADINRISKQIDPNLEVEQQIKEALKCLLK